MKLHANAALSLKGRRQLCRRVLEEERTLTEAAEAAGVSVRCARKGALSRRGRARADRPILRAAVDPAPHGRAASAGDRGTEEAAVHRP